MIALLTVLQADKTWTKFVTMDPPASICFEQLPSETSPVSYLTLINKSASQIIFKVKTTKPASYIVRPNQGTIMP